MANKKTSDYIDDVYQSVEERNPNETEFLQAVKEMFDSIKPALDQNDLFIENAILERLVEPERMITFQVPWMDDEGNVQVNRGFRVQFNNTLGPYKGGLRFDPSVNISIIKFLGFEQIFKNALTDQPIGGGKGGADFNPKEKSDQEIMRFCQSYMNELEKYIGPDTDVPAGDTGVGSKEIGYLFGQYRKIAGKYQPGVITGKDMNFGGSLARQEATGYGTVYFLNELLKDNDHDLSDKKVIVSGTGDVGIYAMEKAIDLGATVIACSNSDGYVYDENGIDLETIKQLDKDNHVEIEKYTDEHADATFDSEQEKMWSISCDIALPCATENELEVSHAKKLVENGVLAVVEGANMPSTSDAIDYFHQNDILFGPAKAANAGGVAVSALEMAQNSARTYWSFKEVDDKLQEIMKNIYKNCINAAKEYDDSRNLTVGANIASFIKIAESMVAQGIT